MSVFFNYQTCLIHRSVNFVNTNVTSWESQIAAFKSAIHFSGRGSLDTVVAAAGIAGSMFNGGDGEAPSLDIDPPEPPMMGAVFEINAKGVYMTAKLASHYFRLPSNSTGLDSPRLRKTIIMIGSLAGYLEINSVDYTASKWAVRGMFRAMRSMVEDAGYRANLIAPWVMDTPMTVDFSRECRAAGVPVGDPRDVAKAALRCAVDDSICGLYPLSGCLMRWLMRNPGRALAVGAKTVFDLEDDYQGLNSGRIMAAYINEEGGTLLRHLEQRP